MKDFEKFMALMAIASMSSDRSNECARQANGQDLKETNKTIFKNSEEKDYIIGVDKKFRGYIGEKTTLTDADGFTLKVGDIVNVQDKECGDVYIACVCKEKEGDAYVMGIQTGEEGFIITKVVDCDNVKTGLVIAHCKYVRKVNI